MCTCTIERIFHYSGLQIHVHVHVITSMYNSMLSVCHTSRYTCTVYMTEFTSYIFLLSKNILQSTCIFEC